MPLLSPKIQVKTKAFTLVELMVVILIIGILVTIMAGAVVKWMSWQRDPTNPNSSVSQTINTIKQAVTRITQDIQQKAKQDYQALSSADKAYYQNLSNDLYAKNGSNPNFTITEPDPNARAIQIFFNTQIVKNFPTSVANILSATPVYDFDFNADDIPLTATSRKSTSEVRVKVLPGGLPIPSVANPRTYNNFYFLIQSPPATVANPANMLNSSISQQLLTANIIKKNIPVAASTPNRNSSACLLVALESHPKGLKVEDLGSGSISTEGTGTNAVRFIQPGGVVIYHKIHYVDAADYAADKSFKIGSLRVDIAYDTE
jgi:prepilin-type N-terminal cleavage/methylation domain-containing protein